MLQKKSLEKGIIFKKFTKTMDSLSPKKKILFVFEGEKTEKQIVNSLINSHIIDEELILYAFCGDIYQFYDKIKSYSFDGINKTTYDIFTDLKNLGKNIDLKNIKRKEISGIYLFFDYDGHSNYATDEKMSQILNFFNEETENGKLFISYPMVEALKHIQSINDFKNTYVDCKKNINYKNLVSKNCLNQYIQFSKYNDTTWKELIKAHLHKMNYIINNNYSFPTQIYSQLEIFDSQKKRFIDKNNEVSVLSAFPIFIHDYFGNEKTKELLNP